MRTMPVSEAERETYLYVNGLTVARPLALSANVELQPTAWSTSRDIVEPLCESQLDFAVASVFLPSVSSQLRVTAASGRELATLTWNSVWDAVLLSAFCDCEAVCNFQCSTTVEQFGPKSRLHVTNYHLRGLGEVHTMTDEEAVWVARNFGAARSLLREPSFQAAVHALASYRWHSLPRARLALLWSGIEGLFSIETEVVFRLSLYIARFLWPDDEQSRRSLFINVKKLYKSRSAAVHGGKLKEDPDVIVHRAAELLRTLLFRCVAINAIPNAEQLAP